MAAASKKIGLIGGLAFRAGVFYYDQIQRRYAAQQERLELVLAHADVNTVLACVGAGDKPGLGRYLGTIANELFDAGAALVAVTAIAPHLAIDEITRVARGPIVNVLDGVSIGLKAAGYDRVAVFGNRAVMETGVFGTIPADAHVALKPSMLDAVHATYNDVALHGKRGTLPELEFFEAAARELIDRDGAQAILLAGTDLSSFYADKPPAFPHLDLARLHIDLVIEAARAGTRA
jgi:aspartate/glutamate racemase